MAKKRSHGEGTDIKYDDKKELYFQRIGYTDDTGKHRIKAIYGKTSAEVKEKRKAWEKAKDEGLDLDSEKMTFGQWFKKWLKVYKKNNVEVTTFELYEHMVNTHIIPELGKRKIRTLKRAALQELINNKADDLAVKSLELLRTILVNCLKHAVLDDIILKNPAVGLKVPKAEKDKREDIKPFTREELNKILEAASNSYMQNIISLAVFTGMRKGEITGLRWQDVDFKKKVITIKQGAKYSRAENKTITGRPKSEKAYRCIPISEQLVSILKKQKAQQAALKLELGTAYTDNGLVFAKEDGNLLNGNVVGNHFRRIVEKVGIDYRSFHHLRHTFASIAISRKVNIKALSEVLGHSKIQITYDVYGHLLEGDAENITNAVAEYLVGV